MMFYQRGLWPFGALSWSGNSQISVNTKVWASFLYLYFLMGHSRPHFLYFRLFNTVDSKIMLNINFADDWIQTATHWYWKQLLYQLSHNHCLIHLSFSVGWSNPKRLRITNIGEMGSCLLEKYHSRPLVFSYIFSMQLIVAKICHGLHSNRVSLISEAIALPTEPQPLTNGGRYF